MNLPLPCLRANGIEASRYIPAVKNPAGIHCLVKADRTDTEFKELFVHPEY
jgi:hypothetical protein